MKFSNGNWLHREGVTPHYAAEAHLAEHAGDSVVILAPCHPIRHRGDTLSGPMLTLRIHSPAKGVLGIKISHFEGVCDCGPHFELYGSRLPIEFEEAEDNFLVRSGSLAVRIGKLPFHLEFFGANGSLSRCGNRAAAYYEVADQGPFISAQLGLSVAENVYGLGERFTPFIKNGQVVDIWNEDAGTNSEQAYKNVPFYLTDRGYGVFVNHSGKVSFEIGTERTNIVQFSVPGESLEYFVLDGPTPKEVLNKYTALTGRPALPPMWSFGLWLSTSFTTNYDESTVNEFIQGMVERDIPLSVFHYDCFWMKGLHWCDFEWDPKVFPDPAGMLKRLHERGLKVCVWINSYIAQASKLFREAADAGYLLKRPNGDIWQWDLWQPGMGIVDFTNPDAKKWFQAKLSTLIDMGVDAIKTDFGERIPTDVTWFDGSEPARMHNYYAQIYNEAVFEILEQKRGKGEAVLFARSATAGGQKLPVHWGGDCWSTFEAMAESLRGGLSLCLSGFGFWSHDIGGFEGKPPEEIYWRWVQFGLLSTHSRLHGSTSYRVPWVYGEQSVAVLRKFTKLKHRLMPYLWSKAVEAHETGIPVMRAMFLEFPDDPTCAYLDRQYMLGDSILVAPVFSLDGRVSYYLPEGTWTHLLENREVEGGRWMEETYGPESLPVFVRENTILAWGSADRPEFDLEALQEAAWFAPAQSSVQTIRGVHGETRTIQGFEGVLTWS